MKLNELVRQGKISKNEIFYKYLLDTVRMYYDNNYSQYPNVIEFFSPIIYLDGCNTYNFIRSSMFYEQRKGFKNNRYMNDLRTNL